MAKRLVEAYEIGKAVDLFMRHVLNAPEHWARGRVIAHEHPGIWVELENGMRLFVTNTRRIRAAGMSAETVAQLVAINDRFYTQFAGDFAATRTRPWPGFERLLPHIQKGSDFLDVGCGNGRLGRYLTDAKPNLLASYTGIDISHGLLAEAKKQLPHGRFYQRDLAAPDALEGLAQFDTIACVATLQHMPSRHLRTMFVQAMRDCLKPDGRLILCNWQVHHSPRQKSKIIAWASAGIDPEAVETDDFLISWRRGGEGFRYVNVIDQDATVQLAEAADLSLVEQFYSDGAEGNLNLYTILKLH